MDEYIYVATYSHKHGEDIRAFRDEKKALEWRREIADEWWGKEIGDDIVKPDDRQEAADQYFEELETRMSNYESFSISHTRIE